MKSLLSLEIVLEEQCRLFYSIASPSQFIVPGLRKETQSVTKEVGNIDMTQYDHAGFQFLSTAGNQEAILRVVQVLIHESVDQTKVVGAPKVVGMIISIITKRA